MVTRSSAATERCVAGSNCRIDSMVSPMNSRRTGRRSPAGKMSATPPRTENSPCWSTGSSRVKPARTRMSASSIGSMSSPGFSSSEAASSVSGSGSRGSSAAADATTMRAWPVARAWRARDLADATSKCGMRPRYGIDLRRRQREHAAVERRAAEAFEAAQEEARVADERLDVLVGRHDHDGGRGLRGGRDGERLARGRQARQTRRRGRQPGGGGGVLEQEAKREGGARGAGHSAARQTEQNTGRENVGRRTPGAGRRGRAGCRDPARSRAALGERALPSHRLLGRGRALASAVRRRRWSGGIPSASPNARRCCLTRAARAGPRRMSCRCAADSPSSAGSA